MPCILYYLWKKIEIINWHFTKVYFCFFFLRNILQTDRIFLQTLHIYFANCSYIYFANCLLFLFEKSVCSCFSTVAHNATVVYCKFFVLICPQPHTQTLIYRLLKKTKWFRLFLLRISLYPFSFVVWKVEYILMLHEWKKKSLKERAIAW